MPDFHLAIDPGAVNTGIVLNRVFPYPDCTGVPLLVPVDAVTVTRTTRETPKKISGQIRYAHRVVAKALDVCDKHGCDPDDPDCLRLTCLEGFTPPGGAKVGRRIWVGAIETSLVLGAVADAFPEAWIVPPKGRWVGSDKHGWDADPEPRPGDLKSRTPVGWARGGPDRSHQRSAYSMGRQGWRDWWRQSAMRDRLPDDLQAALADGVRMRDEALRLVRAGQSVDAAARAVRKSITFASSVAEAVETDTGWYTHDRLTADARARAKLKAKAAA